MNVLLATIGRHGYALTFAVLLAETIGLPFPASIAQAKEELHKPPKRNVLALVVLVNIGVGMALLLAQLWRLRRRSQPVAES